MVQNTTRYVALDVLRGITIAAMLVVNNPGTRSAVFAPLRHSKWAGCTPTDLVFPFFLFIVGVSMVFSFAKMQEQDYPKRVKKILRRGVLIFLTGLLLNAFPFFPTNPNPELSGWDNWLNYLRSVRILGVLQRIALCYILGGLLALWLSRPKKIICAMLVLCTAHLLILVFTGDSSAPYADGARGVFSLQGQGSGAIDIALFGENHVYHGYGQPFDPEGLLGTLSGCCTLLLGFLCGGLIRRGKEPLMVISRLYAISIGCLLAGLAIGIWYPICKPLWTGSYVLYAGGWAIMTLALAIYLIDIRNKSKLLMPFRALGMNPLLCFVLAGITVKVLRMIKCSAAVSMPDGSIIQKHWNALGWFHDNVCVQIIGKSCEISSLMYSLCFMGVFLILAVILYRKKIIIKF